MNTFLNAHIHYQHGQLTVEGLAVNSLVERLDTPFYCYSKAGLLDNVRACKDAFAARGIEVYYAMKANSTQAVLRLIREQGLGVDLVSGGELYRALRAGFAPQRMVFSGVGKTRAELNAALEAGVGRINVESAEELALLAGLCAEQRVVASVTVRLNPDVDVDTHANITTGKRGSKFGLDVAYLPALLRRYAGHPYLRLDGLAMHIGSQICSEAPYELAIKKMLSLVDSLNADGVEITHLDLGGGFGVDYGNGQALAFERIASCIGDLTRGFAGTVCVEPGRALVADIGLLIARVTRVKEVEPTPFLILDAGMNDLMRPALYQATHPLVPVIESASSATRVVNVVGPVCESTDSFARDLALDSSVVQGDLVAFLGAGAYCAVMSNCYNGRDIPAEVMVDGRHASVIRQRVTQEALLRYETNESIV